MPTFLPDEAQKIIDEFAMRYVVEPLYRAMVYVNENIFQLSNKFSFL